LPARCYKFDEFELDGARFELRRNGRSVKLERIPLELLILLAEKNGDVLTRQEIVERLWGKDVFVDTEHGINTAIRKVRTALRDDAERSRYIQTVSGKGYRFVAATHISGNGVQAAIVPETLPASEQEVQEAKPIPSPTRRFRFSVSVLVVAIVGGVITILWLLRPSLPPPRITNTVQLTSDGRMKFGFLASDGVRIYFSEVVEERWTIAAVSVSGGNPVPIRTPFQNAYLLGMSPDKSRLLALEGPPIEEHPLWELPVLGGAPRRLGSAVGHSASWSPDGQKLAYMNGGDVYVANADGTGARKVASNPNQSIWAWSPTWSRNGDLLRFEWYHMGKHTAKLWEITADGRNLHMVLPMSEGQMQCCGRWTADGKYYIFDSWDVVESGFPFPAPNLWAMREAGIFFSKTSRGPFQLTTGPIHFFDQILSVDDKAIYTISTRKQGELLRYEERSRRLLPYLPGLSAEGVSFSPDGTWMAYVKFPQGELWRSRPDGSEALQLTSRPLISHGPSWSPDGKRIAFSAQRAGEEWQVYLVPADGGAPQPLIQTASGLDPTWSPDGRSLMFGVSEHSANVKIRELDLNTQQISDFPASQGLCAPRWSQNGRYISAVNRSNGRLMLFDFKSRKWTEWGNVEDEGVPVWSKSGTALYFTGLQNKLLGIYRLELSQHAPRLLTSLQDFQFASSMGTWLALTPHDEPILLRDVGGGTEIYALYWDAP